MTLSVIGAGFGRTGTLSLKLALEQLGFGPCYHMVDVVANPPFAGYWEALADGKAADWEMIFAGYTASVDWPGAAYYSQLAAHYPDAKVILTLRDAGAWYASIHNTIFNALRGAAKAGGEQGRMSQRLIAQRTFGGNLEDREHAIAVYERHNAEVKRMISADRLLVYDVAQGWGPLCGFLGAPVPATAFPKTNTVEDFKQRLRGGKPES